MKCGFGQQFLVIAKDKTGGNSGKNIVDLIPFIKYRSVNLDSPCECGIDNHVGGCINLASIWTSEILEETSPGMSLTR